jgi:hypothetical protein
VTSTINIAKNIQLKKHDTMMSAMSRSKSFHGANRNTKWQRTKQSINWKEIKTTNCVYEMKPFVLYFFISTQNISVQTQSDKTNIIALPAKDIS